MSHFTVLVRVPGASFEDPHFAWIAAEQLLAPFNENKCETFVDEEDEMREEYATGTTERVQVGSELVRPWDERFRVRGTFGSGGDTHRAPPELLRRQVPFRELYSTFEQYAKEYCGKERRDPKHNRYGHWRNEQAKWDYYRLGGRWRGKLAVKPGTGTYGEVGYEYKYEKDGPPRDPEHADGARIRDLDWAKIDAATEERVARFRTGFVDFLAGKEFGFGEGPRSALLDLGILECLDEPQLPPDAFWKKRWPTRGDDGKQVGRFDVIRHQVDFDGHEEKLRAYFCSVSTYAYLDADGWREPGRMGWWAMSSATPESLEKHRESFLPWLRGGDQSDWVFVVDCHI